MSPLGFSPILMSRSATFPQALKLLQLYVREILANVLIGPQTIFGPSIVPMTQYADVLYVVVLGKIRFCLDVPAATYTFVPILRTAGEDASESVHCQPFGMEFGDDQTVPS